MPKEAKATRDTLAGLATRQLSTALSAKQARRLAPALTGEAEAALEAALQTAGGCHCELRLGELTSAPHAQVARKARGREIGHGRGAATSDVESGESGSVPAAES